jgi:hypothetical protein
LLISQPKKWLKYLRFLTQNVAKFCKLKNNHNIGCPIFFLWQKSQNH